jgi:hypothetical protein
MNDPLLDTMRYRISRRRLMGLTGGGLLAGALFAACGGDDDDDDSGTQAQATQPSAAPTPSGNSGATQGQAAEQGSVVVRDVIDHALSSDEWPGDFGFVTFKLQTGSVGDEPVYFIRTDASDQAFASAEGLVFVPKLANAVSNGGAGLSAIYLFEDGTDEQTPVLSSAPHMEDFSPAFRVHRVSFAGDPSTLGSLSAIEAAEQDGSVTVEQTDIVVNYPVVKWPGGELPVDDAKEAYLGNGQLLEPVDVAGEQVMFKLHACYPSTRYIVTDVTMPPMATGMNIAPAPGAAALSDAGATAEILVFGSGVEGNGPMGFQKSIVDTNVGDPEWSPFWDHYTFLWADGATPTVLKSNGQLTEKEDSGELERIVGTPDTGGQLFMVNCPVPVVAPLA